MEARDWLTLIALLAGPVTAVVISLAIEARRRDREGRLRIVRMLLATRHMPAHPDFNVAINLVPAEFNDQPEVMEAWRRYLNEVNKRAAPTPDEAAEHQRRMEVTKARLIYESMKAAGLKATEGDIQMEAYVSQGFVDRDALYLKSLQAMPEIAETLKRQAELTKQLLNLAQTGGRRDHPPGSPPLP